MGPFGVHVSILEPGNFIAGTNIFNETFVQVLIKVSFLIFRNEFNICLRLFCEQEQANLMWNSMDEEVQNTYGKKYFDQKASTVQCNRKSR
jgi:hypothetical protein